MYLFLGPTPEETAQQYTEAVGRYPLPPYWSLGFHLCRYGYKNTQDMKDAFERTTSYQIPLDAQWGDIDVMYKQMDFTLNEENFGELPNFIDLLHGDGKKFVTILDPCIDTENKDIDGTYDPFESGEEHDVWVAAAAGTPYVGKVWPDGDVYFPDYFKSSTKQWWKDEIIKFHDKVAFDGLWIDMNEPANFATDNEDQIKTNLQR